MQNCINAQRRYSAGPRLDRARDASLNTNKITTLHIIKGRAQSELLFFVFFGASFFYAFFGSVNHYNGECLKTIPKSYKQDRHKKNLTNFFSRAIRGYDDQKMRQKSL